jgi:hypothetical protein
MLRPMFRVYSGAPGCAPIGPLDKERHLFKEFDRLDEAIGFARHLKASGRVALLIEGDDGTRLDRKALAQTLHHRESEQV